MIAVGGATLSWQPGNLLWCSWSVSVFWGHCNFLWDCCSVLVFCGPPVSHWNWTQTKTTYWTTTCTFSENCMSTLGNGSYYVYAGIVLIVYHLMWSCHAYVLQGLIILAQNLLTENFGWKLSIVDYVCDKNDLTARTLYFRLSYQWTTVESCN